MSTIIQLPDGLAARCIRLQARTHSKCVDEVVRKAISTLEYLLDEEDAGRSVHLIEGDLYDQTISITDNVTGDWEHAS